MRLTIIVPLFLAGLAIAAIATAGGVIWFVLMDGAALAWPRVVPAVGLGLLSLLALSALAWLLIANRPRPEFHDFDLFRSPPNEALLDTPLAKLRCVALDTETTGLRPAEGDEIVSIGAVRVANGRVLTGETFDRLVNPSRHIPESSIVFHGITQEMVADAPPARVVLPQFKAFAGRAVLVAYNAAFDLKFLAMKERETGIAFDNAVLDVLLLSTYLHDHAKDHSLEAIAERLSIPITGRHTALGDAMAAAAIFVAMIGPLQARGVVTLADAVAVSCEMLKLRKMRATF